MVALLLLLMFGFLLLGFPMLLAMIISPLIIVLMYFPELNSSARAGQAAAVYALKMPQLPVDQEEYVLEKQKITDYLACKDNAVRPDVIKTENRAVMDLGAGYGRSASGLTGALTQIRSLRDEKLPRIYAAGVPLYNLQWQEAIEVESMLDVAEMVVRGALKRKETRGHHYRYDYPSTNDTSWQAHTVIKKHDGAMIVRKKALAN